MKLSDDDRIRQVAERQALPEAVLEIVNPVAGARLIYVTKSPFLIGRGRENDVLLLDARIPRSCAAIAFGDGEFRIEKRAGHRELLVNGQQIESCPLKDGDVVSFGFADSYTLVFHQKDMRNPVQVQEREPRSGDSYRLSLLLEATAMVRSELPVEDILTAVVDRTIEITGAERGLLLVTGKQGELQPLLARRHGRRSLPLDAIHMAEYATKCAVLGFQTFWETLEERDATGDAGLSGNKKLNTILVHACIPLLLPSQPRVADMDDECSQGALLGVLYLDNEYSSGNQTPALPDVLDPGRDGRLYHERKQILNTLAVQAASVLANARLVQRELERRRTEQGLNIARRIQQALLPQGFKMRSYLEVTGINRPSMSVGGDYYDVIELALDRTAFIIADVSGKGLGAALVTSTLQGTFSAVALAPEIRTLFRHANRFICEHSEVERYATLFFGTIGSDGSMQYINAGHLPALLVRSGIVKPALESGSMPVGLFPDAEFTTCFHQLAPGDTLVLYTDGITEAMDPRENQFGIERLQAAVAQQANGSLEHMQTAVLGEIDEFTRGTEQADDLTLLILRYRGLQSGVA